MSSGAAPVGRLDRPPHGLDEIRQTFGDFRPFITPQGRIAPAWEYQILAFVELPVSLPLSWSPDIFVHRVQCHRRIVGNVRELFETAHRMGLLGVAAPRGGINSFAGSYAARAQRGSTKPSCHCWGIAFDFDSADLPLGDSHGEVAPELVAALEAQGWTWGGRWFSRPDRMHWQFASGY